MEVSISKGKNCFASFDDVIKFSVRCVQISMTKNFRTILLQSSQIGNFTKLVIEKVIVLPVQDPWAHG